MPPHPDHSANPISLRWALKLRFSEGFEENTSEGGYLASGNAWVRMELEIFRRCLVTREDKSSLIPQGRRLKTCKQPHE